MVPDYPSSELRQSFEKTKQEKITIPRSNFFGNLDTSSKDGKYPHCHERNNQKSILIKKENVESLVLKKLYQKVLRTCL